MSSIMDDSIFLVPVDMDREEVGNSFENYNLNSACVVDKNNKLVGMITSDDVLTVLKEEAEEDALRLAGVGDEEITDGVITKTKRRFNWLLLNLFTAFLATYCISLFGATIEQMVVLAFLMPIVASMGGNAGMQTLKKMKIDPAIASSVFVTTITDVIGFVSFLGVGAYFL